MTDLSPTARVILGMLALGNRTGYEIKQMVDLSTRRFWAARYGQIYPELRHLEDQGLVRGRPEPSGGRARTVYDLTEAGEAALREWLASDEDLVYEARDEGMLKLFFSDSLPERRLENIRAMRALQERKLSELRGIEQKADQMHPGPRLTLELGMSITHGIIDWCDAAERRLGQE
jgi:PadR family transcriptional regulator, regulatory protein AphA